jgi:hypothetical protein
MRLRGLRLTPSTATSVLYFKATHGWSAPADVPVEILPIAVGNQTVLSIKNIFPKTACFLQADLKPFVIRWARKQFIGICTIESISINTNVSTRRLTRRTPFQTLHIKFSHCGGISRVLELLMPEDRANAWVKGLQEVLPLARSLASPARFRWSVSCMAAVGDRGSTGFMLKSEMKALLRCANASPLLSTEALDEAVEVAQKQRRELPHWLRNAVSGSKQQSLGAQEIVELLLWLSLSSPAISKLFELYAAAGEMSSSEWLTFQRAEQLGGATSQEAEATALACARERFGLATRSIRGELRTDDTLSLLQFSVELLCPRSDAIEPPEAEADDLRKPLTHYWTAASHNSCIFAGTRTAVF